jgi:hypothetical protein
VVDLAATHPEASMEKEVRLRGHLVCLDMGAAGATSRIDPTHAACASGKQRAGGAGRLTT